MKPSDIGLNFGHTVAYYPNLVETLGSVNATLFFCQIFHHMGKERFPERGIYKTAKELQAETGLSVSEQRTARRNLRERGILTEIEKRLEHRIYYRLDLSKLEHMKNSHSGTVQVPLHEMSDAHSYIEQEITAENTQRVKPNASLSQNRSFNLPPWVDGEAWAGFAEMRKEIRKPMTERAMKLIVRKLARFEEQGHSSTLALEQSIMNCYADVYEPKTTGGFNGNRRHGIGPNKFEQTAENLRAALAGPRGLNGGAGGDVLLPSSGSPKRLPHRVFKAASLRISTGGA